MNSKIKKSKFNFIVKPMDKYSYGYCVCNYDDRCPTEILMCPNKTVCPLHNRCWAKSQQIKDI